MRMLLSSLFLVAITTGATAQTIPPGYNCTTDELSICDAGTDEPVAEPAAPADMSDDDSETEG